MHLLYLIDSLAAGGAEQSLASLAPHYARLGIRLDVGYLREVPGLHARLAEAGAQLFLLAGAGGRVGSVRRSRKLVLERRPDLVHTTLFEADIAGRTAAWIAGVPVVSSLVNVAYGPEQFNDPRLRGWKIRACQILDGTTARLVVRFHALTEHVAEVMSSRLHVPRDKVDVVFRGRDPERLGNRTLERRSQARAALGVSDHTPLLLAAARQEHQKGLDVLLDALPKVLSVVPSAQLVVAGREGNQTQLLRSKKAQLGLDAVRFLGARHDIPDLLSAADVFVLPSRWEGLGGVLLEAMALEAPIVASCLPAVGEILSHGETALLVPPELPDALAAAIVETVVDREGAQHRAWQARARFLERFTSDRVAEGMMQFYERALSS